MDPQRPWVIWRSQSVKMVPVEAEMRDGEELSPHTCVEPRLQQYPVRWVLNDTHAYKHTMFFF